MAIKVYDQFEGKNSIENIAKLEHDIGHIFPDQYKRFLIKYNGGRVKPDVFRTVNDEMESIIQFFYGVTNQKIYDIKSAYERWKQREYPESFLPIAIDGLGNYIILDLSKSENYGHILFWSHDTPEFRPLEISADFDSFLKSLYEISLVQSDLDIAIATQNTEYFKDRIERGENIDNIKNEFGQQVVSVAAGRNKLRLLKFFKEHGSKMDRALFNAASNGHYESVKYLLSLGLDPNERDIEQNNDTTLIQAAFGGNINIVKALIKAGADINATDKHGQSVLRKAYWSDNQELISYLENLGARG
ncbi:MAG TPA: ankyrin repeat domain-containing protein [Mucilaginibacter sp.]|nr:ankyrin repeat domain-containing protein [Mucilaginibacter sp.]